MPSSSCSPSTNTSSPTWSSASRVETLPIKIFNALRYGYTPTMAAVTVFFVATAALIFALVARFGDLPMLLGAWTSRN